MIFFNYCQRNFGCPNIFCSWRKCQTCKRVFPETFFNAHWAPSIKNAEDSSSESRSAESSEITRNNRTALNLSPSKPARSLQKKIWRRLRERLSRAVRRLDEDSLEIHSPAVESIQPGFQVLSNGHELIQRTRFNGFKFNRRRPLMHWTFEIHGYYMWWCCRVEWFGRVWIVWGRWKECFLTNA